MAGRGSVLAVGAVLGSLLLLSAVPPAAAQSGGQNASAECADAEQLDAATQLCAAELDDGEAVLMFWSDQEQVVTLTDAGAFSEGGEVPTRDVRLRSNEPTVIRFAVTETDGGKAGVGIETDLVTWSVVLRDARHLLGGPWTVDDARVAALFASVASGAVAGVTVLRRRRGEGGEPRQLA